MVKASVDFRKDSLDEISNLVKLRLNVKGKVTTFEKLNGGYSGTNYLVIIDSTPETKYVLKICNGYTISDVEQQTLAMSYLFNHGFELCCHPIPLVIPSVDSIYTSLTDDNQPCVLLSYINGYAGDYLVENGLLSAIDVVRQLGRGLSRIHSIPYDNTLAQRSYKDSGACDAHKHIQGLYKSQFLSTHDIYIKTHPYVAFYLAHCDQMATDLNSDLPICIIHGDPFMDNALLNEVSGELTGFVDFEDACTGPRLFDLVCCIVGNCFDSDNVLSLELVDSLLAGYITTTTGTTTATTAHTGTTQITSAVAAPHVSLNAREYALFMPFMRYLLICNATFRFWNFNINHIDQREVSMCIPYTVSYILYFTYAHIICGICVHLNIYR